MKRLLLGLVFVCSPCSLFAQDQNAGEHLMAVRVSILELNGDFQLKSGATYSAGVFEELVASLRKQKVLARYQSFNLVGIENRPMTAHVGRKQAIVGSRTISPEKNADSNAVSVSDTYKMQQTGSDVQVVSSVRDDGTILVELSVDSSRLKPVPMPESETNDESRPPTGFIPPPIETIGINTSLFVESGVNTVITSADDENAEGTSHAYVIVSATVK